jgi:3-oxoacyl-[acyl-carrier protein] reductase
MPSPVALITGAGRGLGKSLAVAFSKRGYAVAIHCHTSLAAADETVRQIKSTGGSALLVPADIRQSDLVQEMVNRVVSEWGRVDVTVNNAGTVRNRTIAKMSNEEWHEVLASNLDGTFFVTRAVLPIMRKQKSGSILNIASYVAARGVHGAANYAAAKAGIVAFTKSAAIEEGPHNIRVNALLPGFHVTDINKDVWEKNEAAIRAQHLLSSMPDREEMAQFAVNVAELTGVTGQVLAFESRIL